LNRLPRVREFLNQEASQFAALEIRYVGGKDPTIYFLDEHNNIAASQDVSNFDSHGIIALLAQHGIYKHSPKPEFKPPVFESTANCVAWRQTGECQPSGPREPFSDLSCTDLITQGMSGYCECKGPNHWEATCNHSPFTCEDRCAELAREAAEERNDL